MLKSRSGMLGLGGPGPGPWGPFRGGYPLWYPQPTQVEIIVKSDETEVKDKRPGTPSKEIEDAKKSYQLGKGNPYSNLFGFEETTDVTKAMIAIGLIAAVFLLGKGLRRV